MTLVISGLAGTSGAAQALNVTGEQDLSFGTIFAGIPERVLRTDASRAGRFLVSGPGSNAMVATFGLPATLIETGGDSFPLTYAADDGGYAVFYWWPFQQAFDPTAPYSFNMPFWGSVRFYLGATANPGFGQTPGFYSNTVTLTVDCAAC